MRVTRVQFYNLNAPDEHGRAFFNDRTEFDTTDEQELAELWWEFCKENGLIECIRRTVKEEET